VRRYAIHIKDLKTTRWLCDAMRDRAINLVEERLGRFASRGGDWYSALHRPGSWEANTDQGRRGVELLEELGFTPVRDPTASWRILWREPAAPE